MPIYEYECTNLHRFEKWQSMKDESLKECVECGAPVRKILHPAGIIFKGSGWYITDSRKSDSSGSGDSKESKTDTKSEAKSDGGEAKSEGKSESPKSTSPESKSESKPSSTGSGSSESKTSPSS